MARAKNRGLQQSFSPSYPVRRWRLGEYIRLSKEDLPTGKVFYYHAVYFPAHYIGKEPLEILPVGVRSCVSIVYIFGNTFKFSDMLLIKVIEQITLVDDIFRRHSSTFRSVWHFHL